MNAHAKTVMSFSASVAATAAKDYFAPLRWLFDQVRAFSQLPRKVRIQNSAIQEVEEKLKEDSQTIRIVLQRMEVLQSALKEPWERPPFPDLFQARKSYAPLPRDFDIHIDWPSGPRWLPTDPLTTRYLALARQLQQGGKSHTALEVLHRLADMHERKNLPGRIAVLFSLAEFYLLQSDVPSAAKYLDQIVGSQEKEGRTAVALSGLALMELSRNRFAEAVADYQRALDLYARAKNPAALRDIYLESLHKVVTDHESERLKELLRRIQSVLAHSASEP